MSKILIAEDDLKIRRLVSDFLKKDGYDVMEAPDGDIALELFKHNGDIDLFILDVMMPNVDGWEVCRQIRKQSDAPVLMLTARSEEFDQLMGFEAGADDYVTKPFSPTVLMKRVAALLKRGSRSSERPAPGIDGLTVDEDAHEVSINGEPVELTLKEYGILLKLTASPGRVFSREQLLDSIWGMDYDGDLRTVDSHMARLRTKLGEWGEKHLKTVYGIGYKVEENE